MSIADFLKSLPFFRIIVRVCQKLFLFGFVIPIRSEGSPLYLQRILRCRSVWQKRLRKYLRHYIDTCAKEIFKTNTNLQRIIVERLKNMNFKTKVKRKLNSGLRKTIGNWNYRYWLSRLERNCEENRVRYTSVNPSYTSQICNSCGHSDRNNRLIQDKFSCVACGCIDHADINAAKNILNRGFSLNYRWG